MLIEVAVPEMAVDTLTYSAEQEIPAGARVIVEVQSTLHAGIVVGEAVSELPDIKPIAGIIDDRMKIDPDLWDLAMWSGSVCMCGVNMALRVILPRSFWMGSKLDTPPDVRESSHTFSEVHNFNPFDTERVNFYLDELSGPERALMLMPSHEKAAEFFDKMPVNLRQEAILWRSDWEDWQSVNAKKFRIVIGTAGAVFAPLYPQKIIVEDEASENYFLPYGLRISARSLAGRRAQFCKSKLILGGKVPSLKTFIRNHPVMQIKPSRQDIIIADIYSSRKEEAPGIDGNIPLTFSLIRRTYKEIIHGHNVLWILGRQGESLEVYCSGCGHVLRCERCGSIMRSLNDGEMLRCRMCGSLRELPEKCPECGRGQEKFRGKRPGIEALAKRVSLYYPKVKLYVEGSDKSRMKGLILSGHRGLSLLESAKPSLVAWLDIDSELCGDDWNARYRVYSLLYESLYAGVKSPGERKVLVQARKSGRRLCEFLSQGWEKFLKDELKIRAKFMNPPCGYMIELDIGGKISRETLIDILEEKGFFVMDSGDEAQPLCVSVESLGEISKVLEPYRGMLNITVRSE